MRTTTRVSVADFVFRLYMGVAVVLGNDLLGMFKTNLFGNATLYAAAYAVNSLVPLALIPILTRYLSPSEYGEIAMFQVLVSVFSPLVGLSTVGLLVVDFFKEEKRGSLAETHAAVLYLWGITSGLAVGVVLYFGTEVERHLGISSLVPLLAIMAASANFLVTVRLTNWQIRNSVGKYAVLMITLALVNFCFTLVAVVLLEWGSLGRIVAQTFALLLLGIVAWWSLSKDAVMRISKVRLSSFVSIVEYGTTLLPHSLGLAILVTADRYLLNQYLSLDAVGIYLVAFQISLVLSLAAEAFNKAYMPWLLDQLGETQTVVNEVIVKYTYAYFVCILMVAALFWITGPLVTRVILGGDFYEAGGLIGLLALGHAFSGMYLMVNNYLHFHKRNVMVSLTTLGTGVLYIVILIVLLPMFGIVAAASSFAAVQLLRFVVTWYLAARVHSMPWRLWL